MLWRTHLVDGKKAPHDAARREEEPKHQIDMLWSVSIGIYEYTSPFFTCFGSSNSFCEAEFRLHALYNTLGFLVWRYWD